MHRITRSDGDMDLETLWRACHAAVPEALAFLKTLVEVNSFTANAAGVNRVAELTAQQFHGLGFVGESAACLLKDFGHHLILRREADANQATIVMVSHLDTVFPEEEERKHNFYWNEREGRIHGPGTIDIKGGTALMYLMLKVIQELFPEVFASVNWMLLFNSCEERNHDDFLRICRPVLPEKALGCLIFEGDHGTPDAFMLTSARKGRASFSIEVEGRGAHAGSFHPQGANAIVQLAWLLNELDALTDYDKGLTVNVGSVHGGTVVNRVPHAARAELEFRCFDPKLFELTKNRILALNGPGEVRSRDGSDHACQIKVDLLGEVAPWPRNKASDDLFDIWKQCGEKLGLAVNIRDRGGVSDGNVLWDLVPTLDGLGPSGGGSHCSESSADGSKQQEWVAPASFAPKAALNILGVLELLPTPAHR